MLEIRSSLDLVPATNKYLFAYPYVKIEWIRADKVLKKWVEKCPDLKTSKALTSNLLRKQIATIMQVLNLDKTETSNFARFMGHTEKTHQEFYE